MATTRRLIGNIKGPKGDTGATGATGAQGPAGQDGAPGVNDYATTEAAGLVRVGDDFNINASNGVLSIKNAFTRASALAKTVSGEAFATSLGKIAKAVDWVVDNAPNFFNKSTDIVDGFTSSLTTKALSANAGKTLKTQLDSLSDSLSGIKFNRFTLSVATGSSSGTKRFSVQSGYRGLMIISTSSASGSGMFLIWANANGLVGYEVINDSTLVSIDVATSNSISLTTTSGSYRITFMTLDGDITELT